MGGQVEEYVVLAGQAGTDIDLAGSAPGNRSQSLVDLARLQAEVTGKRVAGAEGQDAQRYRRAGRMTKDPVDRLEDRAERQLVGELTADVDPLFALRAWAPADRLEAILAHRRHTGESDPALVIQMIAMPSFWRRSLTSSRICAWIVTSSAVVGSSAISRSGSASSAMAIIARCRMPPLSSCG